jgi:hypothetical protein
MPGFDTANTVQGAVSTGAVTEHGTPRYWGRYFSPAIYTPIDSDPTTECDALWDSGARFLLPICEPNQGNLSGTSSTGQSDAKTFCTALTNTYNDVSPLLLPSNDVLYCYLGVEQSTHLSLDYWNGWANYVDTYELGSSGTYPFYPCIYLNPVSGFACGIIQNPGAIGPYAVWTTEPENALTCAKKLSNAPPWGPPDGCPNNSPPTILWQYAEQTFCGFSSNVDLDLGGPVDPTSYMFFLNSRP